MINYYNIFILSIIFIQLIYIFFNSSELFSEKIDYIISHEGNMHIKFISILLITIFIISIYYFINFIKKKYNINKLILYIFIILTFIIIIEYKLSTNKYLSNIENSIEEALNKSTTGDFILFRSYHTYDIPELFFYRYLNSLSSQVFFGHIGIIIKKNGVSYIMESTEDYYNCEINNKYKNGFIFHKAYNRIKDYSGRVYLCRNNLEKFIDNNKINNFINKYKNINFLENNIACIKLIILFLYDCNILKYNYSFLRLYSFISDDIYKIKYESLENIKIKNDFFYKNNNF
jgi:hemin uptake protein HemP